MEESPELAAARQREQEAYQCWQSLHQELQNLTIPVDVEAEAYAAYQQAAEERSQIERKRPHHVYQGIRAIDDVHDTQVLVDGQPLPMTDLAQRKSPSGFEWGFGGSGPAALAHSILVHEFGADEAELLSFQDFKWAVVATLDYQGWTLTSPEIRQAVAQLRLPTIARQPNPMC